MLVLVAVVEDLVLYQGKNPDEVNKERGLQSEKWRQVRILCSEKIRQLYQESLHATSNIVTDFEKAPRKRNTIPDGCEY